jgi:hypothetical protein
MGTPPFLHRAPRSVVLLLVLAACQPAKPDAAAVERIDLDAQVQHAAAGGEGLPDATGAGWEMAPDRESVRFANPAGEPLLSLACEVPPDGPPRIRFTQYAAAPPGAKALFAMVGNFRVARVAMDARRQDKRWLWTGSEPADANKLEALMGTRKVIATLPGGGEIELAGSPLPRQLIESCRAQPKPAAPLALASPD